MDVNSIIQLLIVFYFSRQDYTQEDEKQKTEEKINKRGKAC